MKKRKKDKNDDVRKLVNRKGFNEEVDEFMQEEEEEDEMTEDDNSADDELTELYNERVEDEDSD